MDSHMRGASFINVQIAAIDVVENCWQMGRRKLDGRQMDGAQHANGPLMYVIASDSHGRHVRRFDSTLFN